MTAYVEPRPTRRRGIELTTAIHDAVATELAENGFDGVTFDRIAKRARMSKATIYGRYRSPAHLVADTLNARAGTAEFTTAGSLRDDLRTILDTALRMISETGVEIFRSLVGANDGAILSFIVDESPLGHRALQAAVDAARARGELGPETIPEDAIRVPIEVLHSRVLLTANWDGLAEMITDTIAMPLYTKLSTA